jgi:hypothetical protein
MGKTKVGGGSRKHGRNKVKCARYETGGRREKNRAKRAKRRAKQMPKSEE